MELRPEDALKEWRAGNFRPAYYLIGEPLAALELAKQLKALLNPDSFNYSQYSADIDESAASIVADALTSPMFAARRLIVVDPPRIPAAARAQFARYMENPLETTTVVFFSEDKKLDPKDALGKAVATRGAVCVLRPLGEDDAHKRLRQEAQKAGHTMSEAAAAALVAECGSQWPILRQELDKLLLFTAQTKTISDGDVLLCMGYQKTADPFALTRLIQARALKQSLLQLKKLFSQGKPDDQAFMALNTITNAVVRQFRAKRLRAAGMPAEAIFKTLRLQSYYDRDYLNEVARLSEERLKRDMELCLETNTALKSKAWLDPAIEIEQLVVGLCRTQALAGTS